MTAEVLPMEQPVPVMPHNSELEAALLGVILANNKAYERVSEIVAPNHFFEPAHARIFEAAARLIDADKVASPLTLKRQFEKDEGLADVGGGQYLFELAASVVSVVNVVDYAKQIRELYLAREAMPHLLERYRELADLAVGSTVRETIEGLENDLTGIVATIEGGATTTHSLMDAADLAIANIDAARRRGGDVSGISTGFRALDRILAGLHAPDLVLIAGRPSMGKSLLAGVIAYNVARSRKDDGAACEVMLSSLEMSAAQYGHRILSSQTGIASEAMRKGHVSDDEMTALIDARQDMAPFPVTIDDEPRMTVARLRNRARRRQRRHGLDLLVVDYIQKITASEAMRRRYSNVADMTEISGDLKALAKELGVPLIAVSQLSRAVEQREDKRPTLADLRESGALEQDADVVIFAYRDEYYLKKAEPKAHGYKSREQFEAACERWGENIAKAKNICELIVAKQRMGPTGVVEIYFDGTTTTMRDLADDRQEDLL